MIPAQKGKDCDLAVGKNVKLSEDGLSALAEINGQVLLLGGKINVEPIYTVPGDVNLRTGNILFLGTVVVRGNVEDGFSVKAAGNIEVFGSVGKCTLDAEGDIVVHQGIAAKTEGKVRCGKSLYSKFIEHAHVDAGENVVVTDGIVHSHVDANKMILCQGKRAQIVGGRLRASEEINSKILGSVAGTETLLEVGYDPRSKERLVALESARREVEKALEEVELNIKTLETLQKVQKKLPPEKAQYLTEQSEKRSQLLRQLEESTREIAADQLVPRLPQHDRKDLGLGAGLPGRQARHQECDPGRPDRVQVRHVLPPGRRGEGDEIRDLRRRADEETLTMPLLPIDLQTLFSQTNQVGKEQAVQKEATPLAQSAQGAQMVQKTEQRDNAVNETQHQEEGPEQVKARLRREAGGRREKGRQGKPAPKPAPRAAVFQDPALGRNIDVTG